MNSTGDLERRNADLTTLVDQLRDELRDVQQRELLFRDVIDGLTELVTRWQPGGVRTFVNEAYCQYLGQPRDQAIGTSFFSIISELDQAALQDRIERLAPDRPYASGEHRFTSPSGQPVWHEWQDRAIFDASGRVIEYQSVGRDITAKKLAELKLQHQEERFRALATNAPVGIFTATADGNCNYVNPVTCEIMGISADECLGHGWATMLYPEDAPRVMAAWRTAVASQAVFDLDYRFQRPSGELRFVHCVAVSGRDDAGQEFGWIGYLLDVTERRRAEETLAKQQALLAHVTRLSTMGELVAGIAHEVNQPLYSILNFAKACSNLLADRDHADLDRLSEWIDQIGSNARRAGEIIKRQRQFVSRTSFERTEADLNEVIRESIELVGFAARQAAATVEFHGRDRLPRLVIDRVQIQQVLVNLLKNAYEAMSESRSPTRLVRIETRLAESQVEIVVSDTGPGVNATSEDVFAAFVTTKTSGMGLGLAISRTIVEAHGGKLWFEPSDQGARFLLSLPVG